MKGKLLESAEEDLRKPWIDWHVNIGNLITMLVLVVSAVGAWYDVKGDIRLNREQANLRFEQIEKFQVNQKMLDESQDAKVDKLVYELRSSIHESTKDVQRDIRDLRIDISEARKDKRNR